MQNQIQNNTLTLENRNKLSISGVESVDGFTDQFINLCVSGSRLKILGENLKISTFNKSTGNFLAEGTINEIKFSGKKLSLIKRVLK